MAKSGISIKLDGFEEMLERIEKAGGKADKAARQVVKKSAEIVEAELKAECTRQNIPDSIINAITTEIENSATTASAQVGWKLGSYDPRKPAIGYLAVYLNYGSEKRTTKRGSNRGRLIGKKFIATAKKKTDKKVKALQKQMLEEIMKELGA
jgi:HK97 gp10 family phage protein